MPQQGLVVSTKLSGILVLHRYLVLHFACMLLVLLRRARGLFGGRSNVLNALLRQVLHKEADVLHYDPVMFMVLPHPHRVCSSAQP